MARYIGPKTKIARKFGVAIYGDDKSFEKRRNQPPGQHGPNKRRGAKKRVFRIKKTMESPVPDFLSFDDSRLRLRSVYGGSWL